jgi:hypothetical protein
MALPEIVEAPSMTVVGFVDNVVSLPLAASPRSVTRISPRDDETYFSKSVSPSLK